jgi:hypothetical protein
VGLWRCYPSGDLNPNVVRPFHLRIDYENGKYSTSLINADWIISDLEKNEFGDQEANLTTPIRSKSADYKLKLESGVLKIKVELIHPQYKDETHFVGEKVLGDSKWKPGINLEAWPKDTNYFDLYSILYKEAPIEASLDEFIQYWDSEFEPKYYMLLAEMTYPDNGGIKGRNDNLKAIQERLRSSDQKEKIEAFRSAWQAASQKVKEKAPKYYFANPFFGVPAPESYGVRSIVVDRSFFFLMDPPTILERNYKNLEAWISKEILKVPIYRNFPPNQESNLDIIIREGFAVEMALNHGIVDDYADFLPEDAVVLPTKELIQKFKPLVMGTDQIVSEETAILIGGHFAKQFLTAYSFEEAVQLPKLQIMGLLNAFLEEGSRG